jgi:hypothetical protein
LAGTLGLGRHLGGSEDLTPAVGAPFRLALAQRSRESARDNFSRDNWRDSALFSRATVEHGSEGHPGLLCGRATHA